MIENIYLNEMQSQKFGVEIEYSFITQRQSIEIVMDLFDGSDYDYKGRAWDVKIDSSIVAKRKQNGRIVDADDSYKCELVTPLLEYEDIELLQQVVRALRKAGADISLKSGIHIHVSEDGHTPQSLCNLINLMMSKEDLIEKSLCVSSERINVYCKKVDLDMIEIINKRKPRTMAVLKSIWYGYDLYYHRPYNSTRYKMLNYCSLFDGKGIEFRMFNSSLHAGEIKAYIQFCLAISQKAKCQSRAVARKSKMENERYIFRCWLLRLGLIGDEFKTCRFHMTKHLSGDSSFAVPESHNRKRNTV